MERTLCEDRESCRSIPDDELGCDTAISQSVEEIYDPVHRQFIDEHSLVYVSLLNDCCPTHTLLCHHWLLVVTEDRLNCVCDKSNKKRETPLIPLPWLTNYYNTVHSRCFELWQVYFTVVLILFLTPNPSLSLYFQTKKLIFGCVDANFARAVTSTYQYQ